MDKKWNKKDLKDKNRERKKKTIKPKDNSKVTRMEMFNNLKSYLKVNSQITIQLLMIQNKADFFSNNFGN